MFRLLWLSWGTHGIDLVNCAASAKTKIREKDVIKLQRGGTGFAHHDGDKAESKKFYHLGPGSGLADLRGQHRNAPSRGGLVLMN